MNRKTRIKWSQNQIENFLSKKKDFESKAELDYAELVRCQRERNALGEEASPTEKSRVTRQLTKSRNAYSGSLKVLENFKNSIPFPLEKIGKFKDFKPSF